MKYVPALAEKISIWSQGGDFRKDFAECPKNSIDYAIMEKANNVVVKQASFQWNDIGSWQASYELSVKDFYGNAISSTGKVQLENGRNNLVFCNDDIEIRLEDMTGCAVIKSGKSLLIKPLEQK